MMDIADIQFVKMESILISLQGVGDFAE